MEKIRRYSVIFLGVIFLVILLFFVKKHILISDKDKVLRTLRLAETYIEKKDHLNLMKLVSTKYLDEYGHTWATLYYLSKSILENYDNINLSISQSVIEITGEDKEKEATVKFLVEVRAKTSSETTIADVGRFLVKMSKEGRVWKVIWFSGDEYLFY